MDLKAPIVSMDIATILGREHHSAEEGELVEVTAYQEEAADQSSIQQYHMLAKSLFDYSKYGAGDGSKSVASPAASGGNSPQHQHQPSVNTGSSILNMLNRVPSNGGVGGGGDAVLSPKTSFAFSTPTATTTSTASAGDSLIRTLSKSQSGVTLMTPSEAAAEFAPTSMVADKATLDALQSRSVSSLETTTTTASAKPAQLFPTSTPATPVSQAQEAVAPAADLPDFLRNATPKNNTPILSAFQRPNASGASGLNAILGGNSATTAASAAAPASASASASTTPVAAASDSSRQVGKTFLSMLKGSSPAPAPAPTVSSAASAPAASTTPARAASEPVVTTPSTTTTTAPVPSSAAATSTLLSALGKPVATKPPSVLATAPAAPTTAPVVATPTAAAAAAAAVAVSTPSSHAAIGHDVKQELLREMHHLHTATITEMRTILHQQHQVAQRNLQDMMTQMKTELSTHMTETLTTKVQQQLSTKLKESMRDTIRDTIRSYLQDAFRNAFESSLLPAFQSGIDRMFEQVNSSVDDGMDGVLEVLQAQHSEALEARAQVVATVSETAATLLKNNPTATGPSAGEAAAAAVGVTPEMIGSVMKAVINVETMWKRTESTVSQLTEMMAQMQTMLALTQQQLILQTGQAGGAANGVSPLVAAAAAAAAVAAVPVKPTPDELLKQGKIAEAIIAALDNKNVDETVAVLAQLTPAIVTQKCSHLVRLCITQQLASDLSVNAPSEGIAKRLEWIKSLVVTIVRLPAAELESNRSLKANFRPMIQAVLESIQAAKEWIARAQYDNGEDDGGSIEEIPHSVHTDLQLLEFVVQSVPAGL